MKPMSKSDLAFLKALGISEENVAPAARQWNDQAPVYETCPECAGMRHRYLDTGQVFCLSCTNRKQREERYQKALEKAQAAQHAIYAQRQAEEQQRLLDQGLAWIIAEARRAREEREGHVRFHEERDPVTENKCRGCDAPCGAHRWCPSCARDKFL